MITRDLTQKDVMVITDMPLVEESKRGRSYTDPSNVTLKDALLSASQKENRNNATKFLLMQTNICFTYLSLQRYEEDDVDWTNSIVSKKNIPEGATDYVQISWLKDIWVAPQINLAITSLINQIREVKPKLIICGGKWSFLFFATLYNEPDKQLATIGSTKSTPKQKKMFGSLNKFRGSILTLFPHITHHKAVVIPILTPSHLFLVKDKSFVVNRDYGKIAWYYRAFCTGSKPEDFLQRKRQPISGTSKEEVLNWLNKLLEIVKTKQTRVCFDVETRFNTIDCIGIAYTQYESLTIPFLEIFYEENTNPEMKAYVRKDNKEFLEPCAVGTVLEKNRNYWSIEDQTEICHILWQIMLHPNCLHIGQNFTYDCQYFYHRWKLVISAFCDTMILHHVLHNTLQKDLAMLASLYCSDYVYWKDQIHAGGSFNV